ncbi:MAG: P-loop NTPase [Clostridia bacterium]|nr:P-loop NTPase [Clostridia bacterium]
MEKFERILVTSCKGGVGKSTVSSNLAYALAKRGKKVLLIDMDLGNRSLDIMLGVEDSTLFDISDVAAGRCGADRALLTAEGREGIYFCPAPYIYDGELDEFTLNDAIERLEEYCRPDFTILDTSGGADCSVFLSAAVAKRAIIVTTPAPTAVRAAEKSGDLLVGHGVEELMLIINGMETDPKTASKHYGVNEMIDRTSVRIIGIVPKDSGLALLTERGLMCGESKKIKSIAGKAFENIAGRLDGEQIPLLYGVRGIKNRKKLLLSGLMSR